MRTVLLCAVLALIPLSAARAEEEPTALDTGEVDTVLRALEADRAQRLLETLTACRPEPSPELMQAVRAAAEAMAAAHARYAASVETGQLMKIREARKALMEARQRYVEAETRLDAEATRANATPMASDLEEIQGQLAEGEALVLYHAGPERLFALVIERTGARPVELGPRGPCLEAIAALRPMEQDAKSLGTTLDSLRDQLAKPLALDESVRRVVVSPSDALWELPFGLVFPARAVCTVPSGSTFVALRKGERKTAGEGVLAFGDPRSAAGEEVYFRDGRRLTPLPGARAEAKAVGDEVRLGAEASETDLRTLLEREQPWRAVHLALHARIDMEQPMLSALILAPTAQDDGFLWAHEVLRLELRTDLVVLSVDRGARGPIVRGEGLVGHPRAFLGAGAPRVLASSWRVDDEATRALMTRFHELWRSKALDAAEALQQAQAHIRSQERWAHPHFWGGWTIYGLP